MYDKYTAGSAFFEHWHTSNYVYCSPSVRKFLFRNATGTIYQIGGNEARILKIRAAHSQDPFGMQNKRAEARPPHRRSPSV
ncbi:hypothetical protein GCM10025857_03440 [Alicyclobacillus contaminans]|nr:hypothetical protein GCM10025857_03440 [Alicyclobacillus contaminans]